MMNKQLGKMRRQTNRLKRRFDRGKVSGEEVQREYLRIMGIDPDYVSVETDIQPAIELLDRFSEEYAINSLSIASTLLEGAVKSLTREFDRLNQALEMADEALQVLCGSEEEECQL